MKSTSLSFTALALAAALVAGCGGGDSTVQASTTTVGQELTDLKKAYDDGIVTEKEYQESKEKILERYE